MDRLTLAIEQVGAGEKVLDVGVGWGELAKNIKKHKQVELYAIDVAQEALDEVRDYVVDSQLVDISYEKIKFEDNQFDTVVCLEVFEHLQNPYHALLEIQRVLKPGGKLLISIPNHLGGHLMIYPGLMTAKFFRSFLKQNYFSIKKFLLWGPVLNKGNVGKWLGLKIKSKWLVSAFLIPVQVLIRVVQAVTKLFGLKLSSLYWVYFFVCENKKDKMDKPLWIKQLEQTTELKGQLGWWHPYYHQHHHHV